MFWSCQRRKTKHISTQNFMNEKMLGACANRVSKTLQTPPPRRAFCLISKQAWANSGDKHKYTISICVVLARASERDEESRWCRQHCVC